MNLGGTYNQGSSYLGDVLGGKYLNQQNPYLSNMVSAATRPVQDWYNKESQNLASQANMVGQSSGSRRFDLQGDLMQKAGQQIGDIASSLYGNAYNMERGYQNNALGSALQYAMAPASLASQRVGALSNLYSLGQGQYVKPEYAPSPFAQVLSPLATMAGYALGGPLGGVAAQGLSNLFGWNQQGG